MARSDRHHARGARFWLPVLLVLVLIGGGVAAYETDLTDRWFGGDPPDPRSEPAAVPPPDGLELPALGDLPPVAERPHAQGALTRAAVSRALTGLGDRDLGKDVHALVADLDTGKTLFSAGSGTATPASTLKLLTCAAALEALGPGHRFETTVVRRGRTVTLVGGGDPLLDRTTTSDTWPHPATLAELVRKTAQALRDDGVRRVEVAYDDSLFSGPSVDPTWEKDYVPDGVVSPISPLWVDEGFAEGSYQRVADPAATAGQEFAAGLGRAGVKVIGDVGKAKGAGRTIATVASPPLGQVVEYVLEVSDNEGAEVLARHVGLEVAGDGSFEGGVRGVRRTLTRLGVALGGSRFSDGSGLSRSDSIDPQVLVDVLALAADRPELRSVLTGLPVAGFTGSLAYRFTDLPAEEVGRVRAKTGTLRNISSLAGTVQTRDGHLLAFVLMADKVRYVHSLDAREALDRVAASLAGAA